MAHIFLSYAREDIETARWLEAAMRARGWEVWWDPQLKAGEVWGEKIQQALESACCVVVLWSTRSITRRWVIEEASCGVEKRILVPVVIESVSPPLGFRSVHYEDLTDWRGEDDHGKLLRLLEAVSGFVAPGPAVVTVPPPTPPVQEDAKPHSDVRMVERPPAVENDPSPSPFAHASGRDEFGRWMDLAVSASGAAAPITQRFRWIEPGSFMMGSPDSEPERRNNEGPRHRVTLTRGFWLADTACTQALWRAVTGTDPSRFKGDSRPVEKVSWNDVQSFLARLKDKVPGADPRLPREAEWEYACRAGTETPFSFGAQITPEQVNYQGSFPYAAGGRGIFRKETVPVKSLPPNAWGLYEMHGNVWEWCADELRSYSSEPQIDPFGEPGRGNSALRAVRGGSWYGHAGRARSGYRRAVDPGKSGGNLGFRLSLSSSEPGAA